MLSAYCKPQLLRVGDSAKTIRVLFDVPLGNIVIMPGEPKAELENCIVLFEASMFRLPLTILTSPPLNIFNRSSRLLKLLPVTKEIRAGTLPALGVPST